jgi:hypothetical protein
MQESSELTETSFAVVRANDPSDGALNAAHQFLIHGWRETGRSSHGARERMSSKRPFRCCGLVLSANTPSVTATGRGVGARGANQRTLLDAKVHGIVMSIEPPGESAEHSGWQ